jgi:hypothetical protein
LRCHARIVDEIGDDGRLLAADPAGKRGQEELEMEDFSHTGSISDGWQVLAWQVVRIFGHYGFVISGILNSECGKDQR